MIHIVLSNNQLCIPYIEPKNRNVFHDFLKETIERDLDLLLYCTFEFEVAVCVCVCVLLKMKLVTKKQSQMHENTSHALIDVSEVHVVGI